jgi:Helix-turn-helix domain
LSFAEREEIALWLPRGQSCRQIAVGLGRSHETIHRWAPGNLRAELARRVALRSGRAARRAGARALGRAISSSAKTAPRRSPPLVARRARFVVLVALPAGCISEQVVIHLTAKMAHLPERPRRR